MNLTTGHQYLAQAISYRHLGDSISAVSRGHQGQQGNVQQHPVIQRLHGGLAFHRQQQHHQRHQQQQQQQQQQQHQNELSQSDYHRQFQQQVHQTSPAAASLRLSTNSHHHHHQQPPTGVQQVRGGQCQSGLPESRAAPAAIVRSPISPGAGGATPNAAAAAAIEMLNTLTQQSAAATDTGGMRPGVRDVAPIHRAFQPASAAAAAAATAELLNISTAACRRHVNKYNQAVDQYLNSPVHQRYPSQVGLRDSQKSPRAVTSSPFQQQAAAAAAAFQHLAELGLLDARSRLQLAALSLYHQQQHQYVAAASAALPYMTSMFTHHDLDMALYGYTRSRGTPPSQLSLSGLRINELSYGMDRILSGCVQTSKSSASCRPDPTSIELPEGLVLRDETFGGVIHYGVFCGPNTVITPQTRYGPFPGKQVNTSEIKTNDDNSFMWEIFKEGRLSHFIDGRGAVGNWMSYVNCARHPREQNLSAIQMDGQIYYEVCRQINPGCELLVWYDMDCYVQFMGVPISMRDSPAVNDRSPTRSVVGRDVIGADVEVKQLAAKTDDIESNAGYQCERCGKVFAYQYYRDKHLKYTRCVDQGDRKFPCHLCSRSFEKRDRLRIHILHVHEKHRPHKCIVCAKSFSQSSSLNKHMRVHSGERPYKCVYCSKAFTASSILRTHIRQHSGEKPFKCKHCGKPFASHAAHDSHVRRTHAKMVPSLVCNLCGRTFSQPYELEFHLHSHEGLGYTADENQGLSSFSEESYSPQDVAQINEVCDETIDVVGDIEANNIRTI